MLILKLTIVPLALLALGIVERLHGPRVAGWLSGFPLVGGPILVFVTMDHGAAFGATASLGAWFGLVPWLAFVLTYTWCARVMSWIWCTICSFAVWGVVAIPAAAMVGAPRWLEVLPLAAFLAAIVYYPRGEPADEPREHLWWGLPARMVAGALLVVTISHFAGQLGSHWSGIFATFPVMGSIITISNHLQYGRRAMQEAVAGMCAGLASVGLFCFVAYLLLNRMPIWTAFVLALATCSIAHAITFLLFKKPPAAPAVS